MSSTLDEAYWTGRDYPGGITALADRLKRPTLSDELNPNRPKAKLGLQTAEDMMVMSGDFRVLNALCRNTGHFPPLRMPVDSGSNSRPIRTLGELAKEFADVFATVTAGLDDDELTDNELLAATREWGEVVIKGQQLMQQLYAMNAKLKARAA